MSASSVPDSIPGFAPAFPPDWPAPPGVRWWITTRGAAGPSPYDSFNLGSHVGDAAERVAHNRDRLSRALGCTPRWLEQVHGIDVVDAAQPDASPRADGVFTRARGIACTIMTADCLPVLLASRDGAVVGAAHAGWRGLAAGVIEATVRAMDVPGSALVCYLGPAIGPASYEVGAEVRVAFVAHDPGAAAAFKEQSGGKYLCDLYALARRRLAALGVTAIAGGDACTLRDAARFYSYRRDGRTGRMAALVWKL